MTVVLSVASRQYAPRIIALSPTIPAQASVKRVRISLTRENWPVGDLVTIAVKYPNGDPLGSVGFAGGAALNRDRTPRTVSYFDIVGIDGGDLPPEVYGVDIVISQAMRTAATVEWF
jgi:hypothetical protein